jgi:hypothetical protein
MVNLPVTFSPRLDRSRCLVISAVWSFFSSSAVTSISVSVAAFRLLWPREPLAMS